MTANTLTQSLWLLLLGWLGWLGLVSGKRRRTAPVDRVDELYETANGARFEVVRSGAALENALYDVLVARGHSLVLGLPGCGKTHNAEAAAERAVKAGVINAYRIITATKDLVGETLFEPRLRLDAKAEKYIQIDPAVITELVGWDALVRKEPGVTREQAKAKWDRQPGVYVAIILDEVTRCAPQFADHLLGPMEHFLITVDGKNYYAPILWIFCGNPPGMDSTTSVLTPAFYSRLALRINLLDVDVDTQVTVITGPRLQSAAAAAGLPAHARPPADLVRLAAGIRYLCWGLPLDRKGLSWLPGSARALIAEAARLDDTLQFLMEEIGKILVFGPDSRRTTSWLLLAQQRAAALGRAFADEDLLATVQATVQLGSKDTFTEGHRPDLMARKVKLLYLIAHHALANPKVRELLLRCNEPGHLAEFLAPVLFNGDATRQRVGDLTGLLAGHREALRTDQHPEAEARARAAVTFFHRAAQLNRERLTPADVEAAVRELAERGAYPGEALFQDGRFATWADRELLAGLARLDEDRLTAVGRAVTGLLRAPTDPERERPILLQEQVRRALRSAGLKDPEDFRGTLTAAAGRDPCLEPHLDALAGLIRAVLEADTEGAAIAAGLDRWERGFAAADKATREGAFRLLHAVRRKVQFGLQGRFDRLFQELEALP
jgi:MoxR-like ATPase